MSLVAVTDVVRELLSPEQWRIVRCATLTDVPLTEVQRNIVNCVPVLSQLLGKTDGELLALSVSIDNVFPYIIYGVS